MASSGEPAAVAPRGLAYRALEARGAGNWPTCRIRCAADHQQANYLFPGGARSSLAIPRAGPVRHAHPDAGPPHRGIASTRRRAAWPVGGGGAGRPLARPAGARDDRPAQRYHRPHRAGPGRLRAAARGGRCLRLRLPPGGRDDPRGQRPARRGGPLAGQRSAPRREVRRCTGCGPARRHRDRRHRRCFAACGRGRCPQSRRASQ